VCSLEADRRESIEHLEADRWESIVHLGERARALKMMKMQILNYGWGKGSAQVPVGVRVLGKRDAQPWCRAWRVTSAGVCAHVGRSVRLGGWRAHAGGGVPAFGDHVVAAVAERWAVGFLAVVPRFGVVVCCAQQAAGHDAASGTGQGADVSVQGAAWRALVGRHMDRRL
jgi:hypothetical protein